MLLILIEGLTGVQSADQLTWNTSSVYRNIISVLQSYTHTNKLLLFEYI